MRVAIRMIHNKLGLKTVFLSMPIIVVQFKMRKFQTCTQNLRKTH